MYIVYAVQYPYGILDEKNNAENVGFVLTFSLYNNYGMCIFIHHLHHLNFGDLDYSVLIDKEKGEEMFF